MKCVMFWRVYRLICSPELCLYFIDPSNVNLLKSKMSCVCRRQCMWEPACMLCHISDEALSIDVCMHELMAYLSPTNIFDHKNSSHMSPILFGLSVSSRPVSARGCRLTLLDLTTKLLSCVCGNKVQTSEKKILSGRKQSIQGTIFFCQEGGWKGRGRERGREREYDTDSIYRMVVKINYISTITCQFHATRVLFEIRYNSRKFSRLYIHLTVHVLLANSDGSTVGECTHVPGFLENWVWMSRWPYLQFTRKYYPSSKQFRDPPRYSHQQSMQQKVPFSLIRCSSSKVAFCSCVEWGWHIYNIVESESDPLTRRAVDLFEKEPLKGNSEVHLHTPTKFGEDRSKDLGGDREQTDRQTNRQTDKRCSIYSMIPFHVDKLHPAKVEYIHMHHPLTVFCSLYVLSPMDGWISKTFLLFFSTITCNLIAINLLSSHTQNEALSVDKCHDGVTSQCTRIMWFIAWSVVLCEQKQCHGDTQTQFSFCGTPAGACTLLTKLRLRQGHGS